MISRADPTSNDTGKTVVLAGSALAAAAVELRTADIEGLSMTGILTATKKSHTSAMHQAQAELRGKWPHQILND